jgi:hypothetical protein
MSRQDANAKKAGTFGMPSTPSRAAGGIHEHWCVVCGRWGSFGVSEGGRNDHHDWYCRDHIPHDQFSHMDQTFIRRFEEVFLGLNAGGGSRPAKKEITPEG